MPDRADEWKKIAIGLTQAMDMMRVPEELYYHPDVAKRDQEFVKEKYEAFVQKLNQEQINHEQR